jgi:hypothetical protein
MFLLCYSDKHKYEVERGPPMPIKFRGLLVPIMLGLAAAGCTHYGVSGPQDLGLAAQFDPQLNPQTMSIELLPNDPDKKTTRNQVLSKWIIRSDFLCSDYLLQLSRSIRDTRLATDIVATVLTGLATIFAQPAVTRPLSGSATIALGVGGDIQSDLFLQQAGDVVSTAIQAVRTRARIDLQRKFSAEYVDYTLEQGLVDVQRYDRETCNLNVGLNEIRASLNIIGPVAPLANNPIIPLATRGIETGGGFAPESATPGVAAPVATTIIPPTVQNTPGGGLVLTPGKVVTTPAAVPPPSVTGQAPQQMASPPGSRPAPPKILHPREPPCQPRTGATACPPLAPELRKRRIMVEDAIQGIGDVAKLQNVARILGVSTPVATKTCVQGDLFYHISHICTDEQLDVVVQGVEQAVPGLSLPK